MTGRPLRSTFRVASALLLLLLVAGPVAAHSDLESTDPADGARLEAAPPWVVLRFTGPIEPGASAVTVTDEAGQRVDAGDLRTTDAGSRPVLNLSLRPGLPEGAYLVRWKILSDDGHPNSGEVGFAVGNATAPPDGAATSDRLHASSVPGRALAYLGLAAAFGAAAWMWAVRADVPGLARPAGRYLLLGAALHVAGALWLFQDTLDSSGLSAGVLASSQVGRMLLLRIVAGLAALVLAGLAVLPGNPSRLGRPAAAGFLAVAAVATAAVGHAAGEGLPALALDALHLVASTTWAGGLVLLLVALRLAHGAGLPVEEVRRIGLRFGTVALACVVVLVLTGAGATLFILGAAAFSDPLHLAESQYGRLLLAKVALAGLMVALAAANRFIFLAPGPRTGAKAALASVGPDGTARGLRRTVLVEALVGFAVLVIAAFLTATSPTDHAAGHDGGHVHLDHGSAAHIHAAAALPSMPLISPAQHRAAMMLQPLMAPLHEGHEGGGLFDWYNFGMAFLVLAVLGVVGFVLYKVAKRRRGD